jgi:hypothetical protein
MIVSGGCKSSPGWEGQRLMHAFKEMRGENT